MLSDYYKRKTVTKKFEDDLNWSLGEIKGKRVIIYGGAGEGFLKLLDKYPFNELNIVALADMQFKQIGTFQGFKAIRPIDLIKFKNEYDVILVANENNNGILHYLIDDLCLNDKDIRTIFNEDILEERISVPYLDGFKFEVHLKKLIKKLEGKKVLIYGAGVFFQAIHEFYDLSGLNIIGISDRKFSDENASKEFLGYKTFSPEKIVDAKPDYVLVATKNYVNIIAGLEYNVINNAKIKIKPLVHKPLKVLLKEIWG